MGQGGICQRRCSDYLLQGACIASVTFLLSALAFLAILPHQAHAAGDNTAPEIKSITIQNPVVEKPGALRLLFDVAEEETGVSYLSFLAYTHDGSRTAGKRFYFDEPQYSGPITIDFEIPENMIAGDWEIREIRIGDDATNERTYLADYNNTKLEDTSGLASSLNWVVFKVEGDFGDTTPPKLVSIQMLTTQVAKPGVAKARLKLEEASSGSGITRIYFSANWNHGRKWVNGVKGFGAGTQYSGYVDIEIPIDANMPNGTFYLGGIVLEDAAGNTNSYSQPDDPTVLLSQVTGDSLATPTFTVTGVEVDITPPLVTGVKILNDSSRVGKPGVLRVRVDFIEEESGLSSLSIGTSQGVLKNNTPGGYYDISGTGESPLHTGSVVVNVDIYADAADGDWYINSIHAIDAAGNSEPIMVQAPWHTESYLFMDNSDTGIRTVHFTVEDEFDFQVVSALSNAKLVDSIKAMPDGAAAKVLIGSKHVLPAEAVKAIAGTNKTIVCYKGSYQWVFEGSKMTGPAKDINLDLSVDRVPAEELDAAEDVVRLVFADNGELPGPVQVRFKSDYLYTFQKIRGKLLLYYVSPDNAYTREKGVIELLFDGSDSWCYVDLTHNSKFVISPVAMDPPKIGKATITVANQIYSGNLVKPKPIVKLNGSALKLNRDYTLSYKNNKKVGTVSVTVKGKGSFSGKRTVKFKIKAQKKSKQSTGKRLKPAFSCDALF